MTQTLPAVTLILGGARSGKSVHAEQLALIQGGSCVYLATAEARDPEMITRIAVHQARRGERWQTHEEPLELAAALTTMSAEAATGVILVDCLTLWLSNVMAAGRDPDQESAALIEALPKVRPPVIFVSNEVGLGIVPDNALARQFIDHAGRLHQKIGAAARSVIFMTAGLPLTLKPAA